MVRPLPPLYDGKKKIYLNDNDWRPQNSDSPMLAFRIVNILDALEGIPPRKGELAKDIVTKLLEAEPTPPKDPEYSAQMMKNYNELTRVLNSFSTDTEEVKHLKYLALCIIESNLRHKSQDTIQANQVHQQVCAAYIDMGGTIVGMEKKEEVVVQAPDWAQNVAQPIKKERTWMEFAKTIIKAVYESPLMMLNGLKKLVTGNIIDKKTISPPPIPSSPPPIQIPSHAPPPIPKAITQGLGSVTHNHSDERATAPGISSNSTSSEGRQVF